MPPPKRLSLDEQLALLHDEEEVDVLPQSGGAIPDEYYEFLHQQRQRAIRNKRDPDREFPLPFGAFGDSAAVGVKRSREEILQELALNEEEARKLDEQQKRPATPRPPPKQVKPKADERPAPPVVSPPSWIIMLGQGGDGKLRWKGSPATLDGPTVFTRWLQVFHLRHIPMLHGSQIKSAYMIRMDNSDKGWYALETTPLTAEQLLAILRLPMKSSLNHTAAIETEDSIPQWATQNNLGGNIWQIVVK